MGLHASCPLRYAKFSSPLIRDLFGLFVYLAFLMQSFMNIGLSVELSNKSWILTTNHAYFTVVVAVAVFTLVTGAGFILFRGGTPRYSRANLYRYIDNFHVLVSSLSGCTGTFTV